MRKVGCAMRKVGCTDKEEMDAQMYGEGYVHRRVRVGCTDRGGMGAWMDEKGSVRG